MRFKKYNFIIHNYSLSKFNDNNLKSASLNLQVQLGHYSYKNSFPEQSLILSNLTNQFPVVGRYTHGKKNKKTVSLICNINRNNSFMVIDKLVNVLFPSTFDFRSFKQKKNKIFNLVWQSKKHFEWPEIKSFISNRMMLLNKLAAPLIVSFQTKGVKDLNSHLFYLRALRIPVVFYTKKDKWFNSL